MKIDGYNIIKDLEGQLSGITEPRTHSRGNREDLSGLQGKDIIELSPKAIEFGRIKGATKGASEIRESKVEGLINEVRRGEYKVNAEEVASRLLREHIMDALL